MQSEVYADIISHISLCVWLCLCVTLQPLNLHSLHSQLQHNLFLQYN